MENKIILIYSTFPDKDSADKVAKELIESKLCGCVNIFLNEKSLFFWQGKLESYPEYILLAKTLPEKEQSTKEKISKLHPYSTPFIGSWAVQANQEYYNWLKNELD